MFDIKPVVDFVVQFTGIDPKNVRQGYGRKTVLPQTQDFCIISNSDFERVGTNVQTWSDNETQIKKLMRYGVIIDFVGQDRETQATRASTVETLSRSLEASAFFQQYDIGLLYASPPQYLPFVTDLKSYSHRYRVQLNLEQWSIVTLPTQTAAKIVFNRIVNVDTMKEENEK